MTGLRARARTTIHTHRLLGPLRFAARSYRYVALRGLRSGLACVVAEIAGRGGEVYVDDRTIGGFWLRLRTSDISVAAKVLLEKEYDLPLREQPAMIIDAGAYTGISARWFAARYPGARVIALEPDPANFDVLQRNVREIPHIHPTREALWSADEPVYLRSNGLAAWASQVGRVGADSERVSGVTVATLMGRLGIERVDLLKLDIEGSERDLFESGTETWLPRVDAIAVEVHEDLRHGARAAILSACSDFRVTEVGHETLLLERQP